MNSITSPQSSAFLKASGHKLLQNSVCSSLILRDNSWKSSHRNFFVGEFQWSWRVSSWEISVESLHNESLPYEFWNCLGEFSPWEISVESLQWEFSWRVLGLSWRVSPWEISVESLHNESSPWEFWNGLGGMIFTLDVFDYEAFHQKIDWA